MKIHDRDNLWPESRDAFLANDAARLADLYDDGAVVFDIDGVARGREEIARWFVEFFAQFRVLDYDVLKREEFELGPDAGCGIMEFRCTLAVTNDPHKTMDVTGRSTEVFRKRGDRWLFISDHISVEHKTP